MVIMGKYTDYKGVTKETHPQMIKSLKNKVLRACFMLSNGKKWNGIYRLTDREAALDYDKKMLEIGKIPVNILVKK